MADECHIIETPKRSMMKAKTRPIPKNLDFQTPDITITTIDNKEADAIQALVVMLEEKVVCGGWEESIEKTDLDIKCDPGGLKLGPCQIVILLDNWIAKTSYLTG